MVKSKAFHNWDKDLIADAYAHDLLPKIRALKKFDGSYYLEEQWLLSEKE